MKAGYSRAISSMGHIYVFSKVNHCNGSTVLGSEQFNVNGWQGCRSHRFILELISCINQNSNKWAR